MANSRHFDLKSTTMDNLTVYIHGSTPESVCNKVIDTLSELSELDVKRFCSFCILAAATHRNELKRFMEDIANAGIVRYVTRNFSINNKLNLTSLSLIGHCLLAGGIADEGVFIPAFRAKMGGRSAWEIDPDKCRFSAEQKKIVTEKALRFRYVDAHDSGRKLLLAIVRKSLPDIDFESVAEDARMEEKDKEQGTEQVIERVEASSEQMTLGTGEPAGGHGGISKAHALPLTEPSNEIRESSDSDSDPFNLQETITRVLSEQASGSGSASGALAALATVTDSGSVIVDVEQEVPGSVPVPVVQVVEEVVEVQVQVSESAGSVESVTVQGSPSAALSPEFNLTGLVVPEVLLEQTASEFEELRVEEQVVDPAVAVYSPIVTRGRTRKRSLPTEEGPSSAQRQRRGRNQPLRKPERTMPNPKRSRR